MRALCNSLIRLGCKRFDCFFWEASQDVGFLDKEVPNIKLAFSRSQGDLRTLESISNWKTFLREDPDFHVNAAIGDKSYCLFWLKSLKRPYGIHIKDTFHICLICITVQQEERVYSIQDTNSATIQFPFVIRAPQCNQISQNLHTFLRELHTQILAGVLLYAVQKILKINNCVVIGFYFKCVPS